MNLLLGAVFVLLWGSAYNAARVIALEWPPLWAIGLRFGLVAPILLAVFLARRARLPSWADGGRLMLMGLLGTGGYLGCAWVASAHIPSGLVALLSATAPLFVALGQRARGERLTGSAWLGLALGWLGVAVLGVSRSADGMEAAEAWGIGLALFGALLLALGMVAFAPARGRVDPWTANLGQTAVAAVLLLSLAALFAGPPPTDASREVALAMLWSCLVIGVFAYWLLFVVIRRFGATDAAALQLLSPPVAALIGWALLGERLGWGEVLGGAITLAGLALMFRARRAP